MFAPGLLPLLWCTAAALAEQPPVAKEPAKSEAEFVRISRDRQQRPLALETAIARFEPAEGEKPGVAVDLVAAVHVGEASYYEQLNKAFADYDVVLYELIAPEGTRIAKTDDNSRHPVGALQNGLKDLLELEFQLKQIDYTKPNFVHADMSPEMLAKSMEDRGETVWSMMFQMIGEGMSLDSERKSQGKSFEGELLLALLDKQRALKLKRLLAGQLQDMGRVMPGLGGAGGSTLITERNKVALAGLSKQLTSGKKKVAIFYGAGHLADMQSRLEQDFHLHRTGDRWLTAWNLADPAAKNAAADAAKP